MPKRGCVLILALLPLINFGCGGGSETDSGAGGTEAPGEETGSVLNDADWRAITNSKDILAGIEFDGSSGILTVVNDSDEVAGQASLTTYDLTTGAASELPLSDAAPIEPGESSTGRASFPDDSEPGESALISLSLGDQEAAIFVPSATYAELSPAITGESDSAEPDMAAKSTYTTPNPGTWNFSMTAGSNCVPSNLTASGETTFYLSADGYSAVWFADASVITFNRVASGATFESPTYYAPISSGEDIVYVSLRYRLTPTSQALMSGFLEWDNHSGCSAENPILMEFVNLSNPSTIALCEGAWTIDYNPIICQSPLGPVSISPSSIPAIPYPIGDLDVSYAGDVPTYLTYGALAGYQMLPNLSGSNIYGTGNPSMTLGSATDPNGNPLIITGGFQMTALSTTSIFGTMTIVGYGLNSCAGTTTFTMTYGAGGC